MPRFTVAELQFRAALTLFLKVESLNQTSLADKTGLKQSVISDAKTGRRPASGLTMEKIASTYGYDLIRFLGHRPPPADGRV